MKNENKKEQITCFLDNKKATTAQSTEKTETAYMFLRKTVLQLSRKQQRLLHYVIVHKAKDGTGTYFYEVQASYNGNTITISATTLNKSIHLLTTSITGETK